jgi:hypothetical protein
VLFNNISNASHQVNPQPCSIRAKENEIYALQIRDQSVGTRDSQRGGKPSALTGPLHFNHEWTGMHTNKASDSPSPAEARTTVWSSAFRRSGRFRAALAA